MAAHSNHDDDGLITGINVTPLVDIVLVLLIIFMVAAPMVAHQAIKVNLPKAASGKSAPSSTVAITLRTDGSVYLNGKATTREALEQKLRDTVREKKSVRAVLSADTTVPHGRVVAFLDLLNQVGITKYAVSVEKPSTVATRATGS